MPKFEDFLNAFNYDPDTFKADEFKAALTAAYQDDKTVWDAQIAEQATKTTELDKQLHEAKVANWDLLMGKGTPLTDTARGMGATKPEDVEEPPAPDVSSFFGTPPTTT